MSKRNNSGTSNTLLNYFSRTPPANKSKVESSKSTSNTPTLGTPANGSKPENKKRERSLPPSDKDDSILLPMKRKRVHLTIEDSDPEDQADNGKKAEKTSKSDETNSSEKRKISLESFKYGKSSRNRTGSDPESDRPSHDASISRDASTSYEASTSHEASTSIEPSTTDEQSLSSTGDGKPDTSILDEGDWVHSKLQWLKPHMITDAKNRRPDDPEYDPSSLFVPSSFLNKQTPAHKQWWKMKAQHYDCVLFFKVGKFYELYHMDAVVGVKELGFSYMKSDYAHSGFPESAYARMASTLVSKGYKVARVEQTETPEMMQERVKNATGKSSKEGKVVRREICQVSMLGTQVCSVQDPGPAEANANYMLAIAEEERQGCSVFGVCFVDTSIGLFHLGQFSDDRHSSRLLTTLAHYPPAIILYDRKGTLPKTSELLATHCPSARREHLSLWTPEKTLKTLAEKYYKTNEDGDWPEGIKPFLNDGDALGMTPATDCHLAIRALSGCVSFLTVCLLDLQVLGMAQFTTYNPPDVIKTSQEKVPNDPKWQGGTTMVLDAITLRNLRIVQDEGCLYDRLNFCTTPMGKRLLYQWVCAPSCNLPVIEGRQLAVKSLYENHELCQEAKAILVALPDLERLLAKVHSLGNYLRSKHHPDSRAIFYEEKIYSKRKVADFITILNGFTEAQKLADLFTSCDAELLKQITQFAPQGKFPDYRNTLKFFKESFNQAEAEKEGRIMPGAGVDDEYDDILQEIENIKDELKDYLKQQERFFKCRLSYVGTDKKRYQIEVPIAAVPRAGENYQMVSSRKGFKRFTTPETKEFLARMMEAEVKKSSIMTDLSRRLFEKFSSHYNQWEGAVQCVATLDILLALAEFARQQTGDVCLPTITYEADKKPYIKIKEGRHPCIPITNDFIPNDTELGDQRSLLLLTGPNMGGKSTLMRQVGLLTVLSHLGSYVPAQECSLSLVDRVFTRLGAADDILSGQSTFFVEMNETAAIVANANGHSLVLLDELGRGTSTHDGTAIASAVCEELADRACRALFSTHYHSLVSDLEGHPGVLLGHMACMVETDEATPDDSDEIPEETITFLYKLAPGSCPKSYGFNAARLAGIPREITVRGHQISKELEEEAVYSNAIRDIFQQSEPKQMRNIISKISL